jgi:hypothetical protein
MYPISKLAIVVRYDYNVYYIKLLSRSLQTLSVCIQ